MKINLNAFSPAFNAAREAFAHEDVLDRIWAHDHTVWAPDPEEISNRLGWLDIADRMRAEVPRLMAFADQVRSDGITAVVLLGMGGSSLAPEVFARTFGSGRGFPELRILDSTDPGAISAVESAIDLESSLFIVASKSGGTVETFSLFKYFFNRMLGVVGEKAAGSHFVAITDPGSRLAEVADHLGFRAAFVNDPHIGGRYSALSLFGLVPAALIGMDLDRLLGAAAAAGEESRRPGSDAEILGLAMGVLAKNGRDKLSLVAAPEIAAFTDWIEQLVAESTGKRGMGILPIASEPHDADARYGDDRFFVGLALDGDETVGTTLAAAESEGHPTALLTLDGIYDLGRQFLVWELATAIAGRVLGIQPFNQPNVESAKVLAREMVAQFHEEGALPDSESTPFTAGQLAAFIEGVQPPAYIAVQAYVPAAPETDAALTALQHHLRRRTGAAVTLGYGPRFLHSTGQLHKGDAGNGVFIQITSDSGDDLPIPDQPGSAESAMSFNVLKLAQALGDSQALRTAEPPRRVIRFHLDADEDPAAAIESVVKGMGE